MIEISIQRSLPHANALPQEMFISSGIILLTVKIFRANEWNLTYGITFFSCISKPDNNGKTGEILNASV